MERLISTLLLLTVMCDGYVPIPDESFMNMPELITRVGEGKYSMLEHIARTSDGYMLGVHHVRSQNKQNSKFPPVLVMHGILGSSEDYLRMGPNKSLPLLLAESGYDVWLGNLRGNIYTHHITLAKSNPEFWNYSLDEHGKYDMTAMIDLVLAETGAPRILFVGYSLGACSFIIACNARPDLTSKIVAFVAMAPATNIAARLKPRVRDLFNYRLPRYLHAAGLDQASLGVNVQSLVTATYCSENSVQNPCYKLVSSLVGPDEEQLDWDKSKVIIARLPPSSLRTIAHFGQTLLSGKLTKYDWGRQGNMEKYGQPFPEAYNYSAIDIPTHIFYGLNDMLVTPAVVTRFARALMKTNPMVTIKPINYPHFNHIDFLFSKDIHNLLNKRVKKALDKFSSEENNRSYNISNTYSNDIHY